MIGKTIDELKIGDKAQFSKTISETDIPYIRSDIVKIDFDPRRSG